MQPIQMSNFRSIAMPMRNEERSDDDDNQASSDHLAEKQQYSSFFSSVLFSFACVSRRSTGMAITSRKQLIHSIKVGVALGLASLLFLLQPLYQQVGKNAMWAIMTVAVVFEFTAGAVLSKGINRAIGTILGGGLGCLAAFLALWIGGTSSFIIIGISIFICGSVASYVRLIPNIKKRFDYGVMVFILTFNLVAVSSSRGFETIKIASDRLFMIGIGFAIAVLTSLFIFPIWASDELHHSLVSKFDMLALSIQVCLKEYFELLDTSREPHADSNISSSKSVLHSKTTDEMMANFAKWERWHGKFGFSYPWGKYSSIGELLRELAACILSLEECAQSHCQPSPFLKLAVKEPCEAVGTLLSFTLRELGDGICNMRQSRPCELIIAKLRLMRLELSAATFAFHSRDQEIGNNTIGDRLPIASFMFILMDMVEKAEVLAKEVEELGDLAGFLPQ